MDAVKFFQEREIMCNSFLPDCEGCRVDEEKPVISECYQWMFENPEIAVKIVEEWSAAHQRKTRQSVFLEQWPNAKACVDGVLDFCPMELDERYPCQSTDIEMRCQSCRLEFWMQEVDGLNKLIN